MSTIKPRDLVRTPSGRTARVVDVLPGHRRLCQYEDNGQGVEILARLLQVVASAPVLPWKKRSP